MGKEGWLLRPVDLEVGTTELKIRDLTVTENPIQYEGLVVIEDPVVDDHRPLAFALAKMLEGYEVFSGQIFKSVSVSTNDWKGFLEQAVAAKQCFLEHLRQAVLQGKYRELQ